MAISNLNPSPDEKLTQKLEATSTPEPQPKSTSDEVVDQSTDNLVKQPTKLSTHQLTEQSINQSTGQLTGPPVDRPVAFYIPKIVHKKIDEAVLYYQENHSKKIDRSAVVSAILGNPNIWTPEALDQMVDKAIDQLTGRLTSRLSG